MKKVFFFTFFTFYLYSYCQKDNVYGNWILDNVFYSNGNQIEINHYMYSVFLEYYFDSKIMKYDNHEFEISINDNKIVSNFRKINYKFENEKLILSDDGDELVYEFLRKDDFLKKYPEFELKEFDFGGQIVFIPNKLIKHQFNYKKSLMEFIMLESPILSNGNKNFEFKIKFILSKDTKIEKLSIENNISEKLKFEIYEALMKAEKFFKNDTGKDLLINESYAMYNSDVTKKKEMTKFYNLFQKGNQFYNNNDFNNAIKIYESIIALKEDDKYKGKPLNFYKTKLYLGISYLAINEIDKACICFKSLGNKTNFDVRKYLINFCE